MDIQKYVDAATTDNIAILCAIRDSIVEYHFDKEHVIESLVDDIIIEIYEEDEDFDKVDELYAMVEKKVNDILDGKIEIAEKIGIADEENS